MNKDNIQSETRRLFKGIAKVAKIIRPTYGPAGSNIIVEHRLLPYHEIVNDGKTIVDAIKLSDPVEQIGANILKEVSDKAEKDSGDGRKTTIILTESIIREGMKSSGTPLDVKRSLDECLPRVLKSLKKYTKDITVESVGAVAAISAENEMIGTLLQEIYTQIGKDGIVEIDHSHTFETSYEIKEGVRLRNAGYISPYMANQDDLAVFHKPHVLITRQKISTLQDVNPIFEKLSGIGKSEIVIFCDDIDPKILLPLQMANNAGVFKTLIIKAPRLWIDWLFEDFAEITGATIVCAQSGIELKDVEVRHLGTCEKLITSREDTTVIGIKNVSEHIKKLEEAGKTNDQMKIRASWLQTKAAILRLGANSESELSYLTKKAKDGRNAAYLALKGGVLPGGGVALTEITVDMPGTIGGNILRKALLEPQKQIRANAGEGFKITKDILDPALVVTNAITNAISVAGTVLTSKCVITLPKEIPSSTLQQANQPLIR